MNSTINHRPKYSILMIAAIAYIAGIGTYELFQHNNLSGKLDTMNTQLMMMDSGGTDTTSACPCPCDNEHRYDVYPADPSLNDPISSIPECSTMVSNANPRGVTISGKGAWFSKVTLDNMFCHKADANGIYVYKAVTAEGEPTYIVEAARSNKILSTDDGSSYIYYSRTLCPTVCGDCGM